VGLAVALNIFQGGVLFYGFTLIIGPMSEETGWSRTAITAVFPILGLMNAVIAPFLGMLFDKIGPRPLLGGGMVMMGGGMMLLARADSLPAFYAAYVLAQMGSAGMWSSTGPAVANWFVRRRGRALGAFSLGYALSGTLSPFFYWLITSVGWRDAMATVGFVAWALLVPAVLVIRRRPEDHGLWPDGADGPPVLDEATGAGEVNLTVRQALRSRAFWMLAASSSLAFITIATLQVHWSPYLESVGFSARNAALFLPALPLCTVVGRLGFGFLADMWEKRRATALAFGLQAVAILLLALVDASRPWLLPFFLAFWGLGFGGTVVTRPALQGELFGRFSFGALQGVLSMTSETGFAFSPVVASLAFDSLGTYRPVFFAFAALTSLAVFIVLSIPRPQPASSRRL
jgi:sugar phosphate permease